MKRTGAVVAFVVLIGVAPTAPAGIPTPAAAAGTAPILAGTHAFPVVGRASFAAGHHDYPATDIIAACGLTVVAPVTGTVHEVNRVDRWARSVDDPATRGGRYLSIIGADGVRYYLAHFATIRSSLKVGGRVTRGQTIGTVGRSGRAGACHVHLGLSPRCPKRGEWWVRRGVVSPYTVLRSWKRGVDASPAAAVRRWAARHPSGCSSPSAIGAS